MIKNLYRKIEKNEIKDEKALDNEYKEGGNPVEPKFT